MLTFIKTGYTHLKAILPPLKEVLSEDGVGSYSRYTGFIIVLATLAWVTYLVIHNHAFPDMTGPTAFIAGGQSAYAANQAKHIVAAAKTGVVLPRPPVPDTAIVPPGDNNDAAQS